MSLVPTVYRSSDLGAPVLSGSPGAFAAVLDAVLVDGYGSKAPLEWIRVFSDGHKRVYRNDTLVGASGYYIRFDDSDATSCSVSAYETMTDVDTGTNVFSPTATTWPKSATANTVARNWIIVGNERCVYFFVDSGGSVYSRNTGWFFGDFNAFGVTDIGRFAYSTSYNSNGLVSSLFAASSYASAPLRAARSYDGATIGENLKSRAATISGQGIWGGTPANALPYPYPTTGGAVLSQGLLVEGENIRGALPGVWVAEHNNVHVDGTIYTGFPDLPAATELLCKKAAYQYSSNEARALIDITNAW